MTAHRKDETVLVTGADGFIGSHLVERLVEDGEAVRALTLYNSFGSCGWLDQLDPRIRDAIEIVPGDVRDPQCVRHIISGCRKVFHLAALISIPYSYHNPESYFETNVRGTLNVLQAATDAGVDCVVHTSTSEVYGTVRYLPMDENHPVEARSPYAASKIGADQLALSFHRAYGTPVTILRPFNTYGPRQSARAVIPTIVTQILDGVRDIHLGALHPTRDFSYVKDTVAAFIAAGKTDAAVGRIINVGTNFEISIGDTMKLIAECAGADVEVKRDAIRVRPEESEVQRLQCDNRLATAVLDWRPNHEGLEGFRRGLEETISWFSDLKNRSQYKSDIYNI